MKYHKQQTLFINKYKVDRKSLLFYKIYTLPDAYPKAAFLRQSLPAIGKFPSTNRKNHSFVCFFSDTFVT